MLYLLNVIICPVPSLESYVLLFCQLHSNYCRLQNVIFTLKYFQIGIYDLVYYALSISIDTQLDGQGFLWFE